LTKFPPDYLLPVLESFKPALKSVDLRTVTVEFSPEIGWENLITSIIVSSKTVDELKSEHQQLPTVRNNEFAIFYQALPFDYEIFDRIFNGEIRVLTTYGYNRIKTRRFDPLALKLNSNVIWEDRTPFSVLKAIDQGDPDYRRRLWDVVKRQDNFVNKLGFPNIPQLIQHCLKLETYSINDQKNFEVTVNPSIKIIDVQYEGKQVRVQVKNHHKLRNLQVNIRLQNNPKKGWIRPKIIDPTTNTVEFKIEQMLPLDVLILEIIHRDSGLRLDRVTKIAPLDNVCEPIVKTFDAFCSLEKLEKMLFEPQNYGREPEKIFENAVTWLLSLAGFEALPLGIVIKKLTRGEERFDKLQLENGYHVGSADIIAYQENERLLLIDCDINTVDPKKVEKLAELKKHFRKILRGCERLHIVPILFTTIDFRGTSPSIDVMIADRAVIKRVFESVVKGDRKEASGLLHYSGI
jgi:hypothetical protein